jgi:uncharacterized protein YecE (DUF72 family)
MASFLREELKSKASLLASQSVFIGTSSWKYPGWCGQLYEEARYVTRGKFSKSRFEDTCLEEYGEVFKTVCVDAGYYKFPDERYLEKLVAKVPADFKFAFKVTDEITIKNFPNLPRHGARAGQRNEHFLNADLFNRAFLKPCEPFRDRIGLLMFEFSQFHRRDFEHGRDFVAALDGFLGRLPGGWQYGVEIRNKHFLQPEYFEMLARHQVAHVYNSWSRMPPVSEQITMEQSQTTDFLAARFLLTPGRVYEAAVKDFSPYTETKAVDQDARTAGKTLIAKARKVGKRLSFFFINNRLEGNALNTIQAMLDAG